MNKVLITAPLLLARGVDKKSVEKMTELAIIPVTFETFLKYEGTLVRSAVVLVRDMVQVPDTSGIEGGYEFRWSDVSTRYRLRYADLMFIFERAYNGEEREGEVYRVAKYSHLGLLLEEENPIHNQWRRWEYAGNNLRQVTGHATAEVYNYNDDADLVSVIGYNNPKGRVLYTPVEEDVCFRKTFNPFYYDNGAVINTVCLNGKYEGHTVHKDNVLITEGKAGVDGKLQETSYTYFDNIVYWDAHKRKLTGNLVKSWMRRDGVKGTYEYTVDPMANILKIEATETYMGNGVTSLYLDTHRTPVERPTKKVCLYCRGRGYSECSNPSSHELTEEPISDQAVMEKYRREIASDSIQRRIHNLDF